MDKVETFENWLWPQIWQDVQAVQKEMEVFAHNGTIPQNFRLTFGTEVRTRNVIWDEYEAIRKDLKKRCYASQKDLDGNPQLMDQHKIASCFCKALINKKVFAFDVNETTPEEMIRVNYRLAYAVSLRIIWLYLLDYYKSGDSKLGKSISDKCVRQLQEWKGLKVPPTTESHDPYNLGREKALALNDYYGLQVDLLTYADMMYWIEYFNKLILEGKIHLNDNGKPC